MGFKKRYLLALPALAMAAVYGIQRLPFFRFATAPAEVTKLFEKEGLPPPEFKRFTTSNRSIHYLHVDNRFKQTLVFLHGSPGSSDNFLDYLMDRDLREKYNLIAIDRPGFGQSGLGRGVQSLNEQSQFLKPLIDSLLNQTVILLGHSYGGPLVARMAMDYPSRVDGIVMVAPAISPELEPQEWYRPVVESRLAGWYFAKSVRSSNTEITALKKYLDEMLPGWAEISIPVAVVQGSKDNLVPKGNADFAKKMLVNSTMVDIQILEGEGHFILWSHIDDIKRSIEKVRAAIQ